MRLKPVVNIFLTAILLAVFCAPTSAKVSPVGSKCKAVNPSSGFTVSPLQFTAMGHVLAFQPTGLTVASADHAVTVRFVDANPTPPQQISTTTAAPPRGRTAAPLQRVRYSDLWDGVTLVYASHAGAILESTYHIAAGAALSGGENSDTVSITWDEAPNSDPQFNLTQGAYPFAIGGSAYDSTYDDIALDSQDNMVAVGYQYG